MSLTVRGHVQPSSSLRTNQLASERGVSRIASGLRIRHAADDAAGLAISEGLNAQIRGSGVAVRNIQDCVGLLQTADGGLEGITSMLQRARDLAVRAANTGSLSASDRAVIAAEVGHLVAEIDRTASSTTFNGAQLLDGSRPQGFTFQVGAQSTDTVTMAGGDVRATTLGLLGFTTVTAGTESTTPTTYTTTSGAFGVIDAQTNAQREFQVSVDGVLSPVLGIKKQVYGLADHGLLRDRLNAELAAYGVSASLIDGGTTSARLEFRSSAGSTVELQFSGQLATALGIATTSTPGTTSTSPSTSATSAGLAALVASGSGDAIDMIDAALTTVLGERTRNGALQRGMEHRLSYVTNTELNLAAARSRIADADVAEEWMGVVRAQVLTQAAMSLQAQSGTSGQRVLQLLGSL